MQNDTMRMLPVWNNRLLSTSDSKQVSLHRSTNGTDTKTRYEVYRRLGFALVQGLLADRQHVRVRKRAQVRHRNGCGSISVDYRQSHESILYGAFTLHHQNKVHRV